MTEDEKMDRYSRGLKPEARKEVELRDPLNLKETMKLSKRINNISFSAKRRIKGEENIIKITS